MLGNEEDYDRNPEKSYIEDSSHPSKEIFNADWDYDRKVSGDFCDSRVQYQYRRLQIANQMHRCCSTC